MLSSSRLKLSAGWMATLVASLLILIKFFAWRFTGSVAVQASMVDSITDAITSGINLFALKHAYRPANRYYQWGYGKAEALASFAQAIIIAVSTISVMFEVFHRIFHPEPLDFSIGAVSIIAFAVSVTGLLVLFQRYVVHKTHSLIIKADSLHYENDVLANLGVIVSLFLSMKFNLVYLDSIVGLCIVAYVLVSCWNVFWTAAGILMDRALDPSVGERIIEIIKSYPEVQVIQNLKTRTDGQTTFAQLHVGLDEDIVLSDAIFISQEITKKVQEEFPNVQMTIHHH